MEIVIRSFCVAACLLSCLYSFILFRFFETNRKVLFTYVILCISMAIHVNNYITLFPYKLFEDTYTLGLDDNYYMATFSLVNLTVNMYSHASMESRVSKAAIIYDLSSLFLAAAAMIVPSQLNLYFYSLLYGLSIFSFIDATAFSYKMYNEVSKTYIFSFIAFLLMLVSCILSGIFFLQGLEYYSPRMVALPLFLLLHAIRIMFKYRESLGKTKELASSLVKTIEQINHSDNALMCTQMKTNFLYNTLDLISERCDSDPDTAEYLTIYLSKYLRHTLNFQQLSGAVTLSNEIELLKAYIAIEKEAHPGITFEYNLPEEIPDIQLPPLSIQPLVENAIAHGIMPKGGDGRITVTIMPFRDFFHVDVSDNGVGISEAMLSKLPECFPTTVGIGLYNISTRLKKMFDSDLVIQSTPGIGTSVSFMLPPHAIKAYTDAEEASL